MITQARLKELLHYDPTTGIFTWGVPRRCVRAGDIAGTVQHNGYRAIKIDQVLMLEHRLAVLYMEGYLPEHLVDHINRVRADNRYDNLRVVSMQCQMFNCGMLISNSSGVKGVSWDRRAQKWAARIHVNKKHKYLGAYEDLVDAAYARYAAEQCLGLDQCDMYSSAKKLISKHKQSQNKPPYQGTTTKEQHHE